MAKTKIHTVNPGEIVNLPLGVIDFDPDQPRKDVPGEYIEQLGADIKAQGLLQPITVRPHEEDEGRFIIVYGECRYRASKHANKRLIPCQLDTLNKDALGRFLNQLKENHHRKNLNAMELAQVLKRLRDDFGFKSQKAIEKTLAKHGINDMSRSYISNMIRLLDLPEWAQNLIRQGELTAAHGKYLLTATASEAVMEGLKNDLAESTDITTRELVDDIYSYYTRNHKNLVVQWVTPFDVKTQCVDADCSQYKKISDGEREGVFCLNEQCHAEKCAAYKEARQRERNEPVETHIEPTPVKAVEGVVDLKDQEAELEDGFDYEILAEAPFETRDCFGCEHCLQVKTGEEDIAALDLKEACFNLPCYRQKTENHFEQESLKRHAHASIREDLRHQVAEYLVEHPDTLRAVNAWIVTGTPEFNSRGVPIFDCYLETEYEMEEILTDRGRTHLKAFIEQPDEAVDLLAQIAADQLGDADLIYMAELAGASLEHYRINNQLIRTMHEVELLDLLQAHKIIDDKIRWRYEAKDLAGLIDDVNDAAETIGAPEIIKTTWQPFIEEIKNNAQFR